MIEIIAKDIVKTYGATRALAGLNARLSSGAIIGIAGPNGAGKSTLIRMLAGEEQPDSGQICLLNNGEIVEEYWRNVAVVHQEPHVWPNMTVMENLAVEGDESWFAPVIAPEGSAEILKKLDILQFADYQLCDLSLAVHQRVEIARAILRDADVFLFDEPNSALTDDESEALFSTMNKLVSEGRVVLLITHRLNDFVRCCGRVLILRDGKIGCELEGEGVTENAVAVELSTGTSMTTNDHAQTTVSSSSGPDVTLLRLDSWSHANGAFSNINLEIKAGTITVLAGVEGSGARELAQAIAARSHTSNSAGLSSVYLAASRQDTVFPNMSVGENLTIRHDASDLCAPMPLLNLSRLIQIAEKGIKRYQIKTGGSDHPITSLSGGNQQKVVIGAAMEQNADILVIEEPTRGVDISSSNDIYRLLHEYAETGKAVVLYCTEVQEMFQVATQVVVMSRGTVVGNISRSNMSSVVNLADQLADFEST